MFEPKNPGAPPKREGFARIGGPDDHFSRWTQGLCAIPLAGFFLFEVSVLFHTPAFALSFFVRSGFCSGAGYLGYRCLRYAITGRGDINRDDF